MAEHIDDSEWFGRFALSDRAREARETYLAAVISLNEHAESVRQRITTTLRERGRWEGLLEWRISTVARFTVESVARSDTGFDTDHDWYRVTVQTEASFTVLCPTIARATQALLIFDRLQRDLFHALGWFSWPGLDATEDGPKPPDLA